MEENVNVDEVTKIITEFRERVDEAIDEQIKEFLESETKEHVMYNEANNILTKRVI